MKVCSILAVLLSVGLSTAAFAQDSPEPKPTIQQEQTGPAHLGGEAPALAIGSDIESRNVLVAGFSLGAVCITPPLRLIQETRVTSYSRASPFSALFPRAPGL